MLHQNVKNRLVLENCEKCFSIEDCLRVSDMIDIPVVFDTHHYNCYCKLHPDESFKPPEEYTEKIVEFWKKRDKTLNFISVSKVVEKSDIIVIM